MPLPEADSTADFSLHMCPPIFVGATVGTLARSIPYVGANRWARKIGILIACISLGIAESTPYPIASPASLLIINQTSSIMDLSTESSAYFWITLKGGIVDLLFFVTTSCFIMAGVWYSYVKIAELLVARTREILGWNYDKCPSPMQSTVLAAERQSAHPADRVINLTEDKIDSAATSCQSDDDLDNSQPRIPVAPEEDQCQSDRLFLGIECANPLSPRKCVAKYRHDMDVTIGDQLYDTRGKRVMLRAASDYATTALGSIVPTMRRTNAARLVVGGEVSLYRLATF